jgi:hypothetical protein
MSENFSVTDLRKFPRTRQGLGSARLQRLRKNNEPAHDRGRAALRGGRARHVESARASAPVVECSSDGPGLGRTRASAVPLQAAEDAGFSP